MGLIDRPRADRFNAGVVPKLGGLVLVVAVVCAIVSQLSSPYMAALAAGWFIAFASGFGDDRWLFRPRTKFWLQLLASAVTVVPLAWILGSPAWATGTPWIVTVVIGVIWVTAFQNAINFLDNMDGIAAGLSAIALLGLACVIGPSAAKEFAIVIALACVGFLPWNVSRPARLYLGDAGSLPLGHAVGGCAWLAMMQAPSTGAAAAVLPIVAIAIVDLTFVIVVRSLEGRSPAQGGRDHTTHRLYRRLGTVTGTRTWFWTLALALAGLGVALSRAPSAVSLVAVGLIAVATIFAGRWLATIPTPAATTQRN